MKQAPPENLGQPKQYVPVFVGSTFEDLKDYRIAVRDTLHRLETFVHGMEYFGSTSRAPKAECLNAVKQCRVYIGIFAMRYGSIDDESGKSMTHLEYDEAQALKLPTLIYIIDEERQPVLPKYVDVDQKAKSLADLKHLLKKKHNLSFFTTPDDLSLKISHDLPPVLQGIGVHIEEISQESFQQDDREILRRFLTRPAKYAGREITASCIVTGKTVPLDNKDCDAFNLPRGDAIKRQVKSDVIGNYVDTIATKDIADWFEELPMGIEITVGVKLLYGRTAYVEWGPYNDPDWVVYTPVGYQITKVLSYPQGPAPKKEE